MSFQTLPAKFPMIDRPFNPSAFAWITRLVLPLVVSILMLTTTGCSMVMGFFGPTDSETVTGSGSTSARTLMPTPVREGTVAQPTATRSGPTPTPFIMRPSRADDSSAFIEPTAVSSGEETRPTLYATILGDSVNVRNAPALDSQILATVPLNTQYQYVDETKDGAWIQVCCVNDQLAWVYSELIRISTNSATAMPGSSAPIAVAQNPQGQTLASESTAPVESPMSVENPMPVESVAPLNRTQSSGAALAFLQSQTSQVYTAADENFSILLPPAWLPLMESNRLIAESLDQIDAENAGVAALLESQLADMNEIPVAFIAFDLSPESLQSGFTTNVNIFKQPVPAGFPLNYVVQLNADQLESVLGLSGTAEATDVILPAGESVMLDYQVGDQVKARQYYLLHDQALYIVTFTVANSLADAKLRLFDEMMGSFQFLR